MDAAGLTSPPSSSQHATMSQVTIPGGSQPQTSKPRQQTKLASGEQFRKPETPFPTDFWYCDQAKWDQLLQNYQNAATKIAAYTKLYRLSIAGRIMETDEGKALARACTTCSKAKKLCKVFVDSGGQCAYCRKISPATRCTATGDKHFLEEDQEVNPLYFPEGLGAEGEAPEY